MSATRPPAGHGSWLECGHLHRFFSALPLLAPGTRVAQGCPPMRAACHIGVQPIRERGVLMTPSRRTVRAVLVMLAMVWTGWPGPALANVKTVNGLSME